MFIFDYFGLGSSNKYEDLRKKDDDFTQKQRQVIQAWMTTHPIDTTLSQLDTYEIKKRISQVITDLNKIVSDLDTENVNDVAFYLQSLAKQSERARRAIVNQCKNLKCDEDFTDRIRSRIILTCTEQA